MNLLFNEEDHQYKIDGIPAVSVSRIATAVTGKSFSMIKPEILEAARIRGETIHSEVENGEMLFSESVWIQEQLDMENCEYEVKIGGYVAGLAIAGRLDIYDSKGILDIKTGSTYDPLYCAIQLNLYRELLLQSRPCPVEYLRVLHTPKSGKYKVIEVPIFSGVKLKKVVEAFKEHKCLDSHFLDDMNTVTIKIWAKASEEMLYGLTQYMNVLGIEYGEVTDGQGKEG